MDILQEIVAHKRIEVERFKQQLSEQEIHRRVEAILDFSVPSMSKALTASESGIIAEFKRRSPSKGWIKEEGKAEEIPLLPVSMVPLHSPSSLTNSISEGRMTLSALPDTQGYTFPFFTRTSSLTSINSSRLVSVGLPQSC